MKRTCKRRKAFLGAIIGAVTGIAGSAISAASQRKAQEKQIKRENYINRNQSANNLSTAYSNEEYVDDFLNKTTFKYGGNKTMACGNRKTAEMGMYDKIKRDREIRRKQEAAFYEQKRRNANKQRIADREGVKTSAVDTPSNYKAMQDLYKNKLKATTKKIAENRAKNRKEFSNKQLAKNKSRQISRINNSALDTKTKNERIAKINDKYNNIYNAKPIFKKPTTTVTAVPRTTNNSNAKAAVKTTTNTSTKAATNKPAAKATPNKKTNTASTAKTNVASKQKATVQSKQITKSKPATSNSNRTAIKLADKTTNNTITKNNSPVNKTNNAAPKNNIGDNKLTFSRAFANARKAGKQTFNWNGKSYTTQLAGEKKNNTSEKTYNTTKLADNRLMDAKETSKLLINTIPSASSVIPKSNTLNIADNNGYYDRIKMMKCGGKRKMKCGGKCK